MTTLLSRRLGRKAVLLATALSAAACRDGATDPLAVVLNDETRSVLAADANLPSLPRLAGEGAQGTLEEAVAVWSSSWELPPERGREVRRSANRAAAPLLVDAVGSAGVSQAVQRLGETLAAAATLDARGLDPGIASNLAAAEAEHARALALVAEGRATEALEGALAASDLVREVGPESVTRLLLARAEARLDAIESASVEGDDPVDLERGRRLLRGARQALGEGDFLRAVQRAFYACQVLGVGAN